MSSSIQLKTTISLTSRFIYNAPLLYTNSGDLAYSIGDYVRQFMLAPPFAWRWNRGVVPPILCQSGQSDYQVNIPDFGWLEKATITYPTISYSTAPIISATRSSNSVTLQVGINPSAIGLTAGQTITVADVTDSSFDGTFQISSLNTNTVTYPQTGTYSVSAGGTVIYNYAVQPPNTPTDTQELTVRQALSLETTIGEPAFISPMFDDNNGNITFRLTPVPSASFNLNIIYQKASPTFANVTDTWSPIPDYYSYLYNLGYLAKTYEYKGDERFAFTQQEFLKQVVAANGGLDDTQKNIFLGPYTAYQREIQGANQQGAISRQSRVG